MGVDCWIGSRDNLKRHYVVKKAINFICIYSALTEFMGENIIWGFSLSFFLFSFVLGTNLPPCPPIPRVGETTRRRLGKWGDAVLLVLWMHSASSASRSRSWWDAPGHVPSWPQHPGCHGAVPSNVQNSLITPNGIIKACSKFYFNNAEQGERMKE